LTMKRQQKNSWPKSDLYRINVSQPKLKLTLRLNFGQVCSTRSNSKLGFGMKGIVTGSGPRYPPSAECVRFFQIWLFTIRNQLFKGFAIVMKMQTDASFTKSRG